MKLGRTGNVVYVENSRGEVRLTICEGRVNLWKVGEYRQTAIYKDGEIIRDPENRMELTADSDWGDVLVVRISKEYVITILLSNKYAVLVKRAENLPVGVEHL